MECLSIQTASTMTAEEGVHSKHKHRSGKKSGESSSSHKHSKRRHEDDVQESKKHKHRRKDKDSKKKSGSKEKGLDVIDDDDDENMWVEKDITQDGEHVRHFLPIPMLCSHHLF